MKKLELDMAEMEAIWARVALLPRTQQKIVMLIGDGHVGLKEIATDLGLCYGTVKNQLHRIYDATRVSSMLQLAIPMYWKAIMESGESVPPPENFLVDILSRREREVAYLVARGYGNLNIVATLNISEETVKRHLTNIFNKLGFSRRTELAFRVLREDFFFYQHQRSPTPS